MMLILGLLVACLQDPEPDQPAPEPTPAEATAAAEALHAATPAIPGVEAPKATGEPVEVILIWQGISSLYRSFFSTPKLVDNLSQDLAGSVAGSANIYIRYDSEKFIGQIRLKLLPGTLLRPIAVNGDTVRVGDLHPITVALARYRSAIAANFDVRVESFHVGIESVRNTRACIFGVGGTPPPDGRLVSPCVEINGEERCGQPTADGVQFSPDAASAIRGCLDL